MSNLLLVSTLQSKLDEGKCPLPSAGSCPEGPEVQSEAVQRVLLQRETEVREGGHGPFPPLLRGSADSVHCTSDDAFTVYSL